VFSLAYVMLPFSDIAPAEAIRASLARFQRGRPGEVPDDWIGFDDDTEGVRHAHEAQFTFVHRDDSGPQMRGDFDAFWYIDSDRVGAEMRRQGIQRWSVRFADLMDLDTFFDRFGSPVLRRLERHPVTGGYGRWLNLLGHWDWWDLGGRFDGCIVGDPRRREGRGVARISSGENPGRRILVNLEDVLGEALGQDPVVEIDVLSDLNVELVATLLADAQAGREHAYPGTLVLPPGTVEDSLRWLEVPPGPMPAATLAWLGLAADASWQAVVEAAYVRFQDHWAAGVAYHF
jgi:hypothetical protein